MRFGVHIDIAVYTMSKSKRVELTLTRKMKLIKTSSEKSLRQLADVSV